MKVLILGTPRSGTSSLIRAIGYSANYQRYGEPWNSYLEKNPLPYPYEFKDNVVVKTLIGSVPLEYSSKSEFEFYRHLIKSFDKTILIGRKDKMQTTISYAYQLEEEKKYNGNRLKYQWQKPYSVNLVKLDIKPYIEEVELLHKTLLEVSNQSKIPITWYEDLYSGDVGFVGSFIDSLGINLDREVFYEWVNPKNRLRRTKKTI